MRIDPRSVTDAAVTFAGGTLTINVPQRNFSSGCPYFLRLVDEIPAETTIGALAVITVGTGTVEYPLQDCSGVQITAERLRSGYSYPIELVGTAESPAFRVQAPLRYCSGNTVLTVDGTAPAEGGGEG